MNPNELFDEAYNAIALALESVGGTRLSDHLNDAIANYLLEMCGDDDLKEIAEMGNNVKHVYTDE